MMLADSFNSTEPSEPDLSDQAVSVRHSIVLALLRSDPHSDWDNVIFQAKHLTAFVLRGEVSDSEFYRVRDRDRMLGRCDKCAGVVPFRSLARAPDDLLLCAKCHDGPIPPGTIVGITDGGALIPADSDSATYGARIREWQRIDDEAMSPQASAE